MHVWDWKATKAASASSVGLISPRAIAHKLNAMQNKMNAFAPDAYVLFVCCEKACFCRCVVRLRSHCHLPSVHTHSPTHLFKSMSTFNGSGPTRMTTTGHFVGPQSFLFTPIWLGDVNSLDFLGNVRTGTNTVGYAETNCQKPVPSHIGIINTAEVP